MKTTTDPELKAKLPAGPWQDEPDKAQWYDGGTDMACLIVRNHAGALCGYVGVEPDHPWHGVPYGYQEDCPDEHVDVHGGLTYSAACQKDGHICHVPDPGREHNVWWFGFDCTHSFDVAPVLGDLLPGQAGAEYRTFEFVKAEVERLAAQLVEVDA